MQEQTPLHRLTAAGSSLILDDTLCEHVGSLFEYVDRHYNHGNHTYLLAHNLVTSHYLSGAVRFPVDFEVYRRYEEVPEWETCVAKHFPDETIPKKDKARSAFHKRVAPFLLQDPEFVKQHKLFCTKIEIAQLLIDQAIERGLGFSTVLVDGDRTDGKTQPSPSTSLHIASPSLPTK
ncbi:hypothetical protein [Leptolyngbya sp. BC1307]|uniref:hypothetical protein n=1 Tax=Leptolyngbya sp. BC1307 TaxID=2029589 RepID=UPI000EFD9233|nr:hypothetical protein [Leptolyngbya sp. BC1307]